MLLKFQLSNSRDNLFSSGSILLPNRFPFASGSGFVEPERRTSAVSLEKGILSAPLLLKRNGEQMDVPDWSSGIGRPVLIASGECLFIKNRVNILKH